MIKKFSIGLIAVITIVGLGLFGFIKANQSPPIFEPSVAGIYNQEPRSTDPSSLISLDAGNIVGFADAYETHAWLGIPYATPPVGELRWKAPLPVNPWQGTFEATDYGSPCIQFWGVLAAQDGERGDLLGQEDCLTLNVWAPKTTSSKPKPVMLWIHGGGNDSGTAKLYQAHHLAGSKEVVVVTINYRLGFLGWFSHPAIRDTSTSPEDASGNYGTL